MPFGTWWRGDAFPNLPPLPAFSAYKEADAHAIVQLTGLSEREASKRLQAGHIAYVAAIGDSPAAYGWVATQTGGIVELQLTFSVAPGNRYLWDFLTLPHWRGRGIYPHLLQEIIRQEQNVERFWIGYAPGNDVSAHGIEKAGFRIVGDLVVDEGHISGLKLFDSSIYARASAEFFQLPVIA
jgi:GNAT superfamily N-acetyltransferase